MNPIPVAKFSSRSKFFTPFLLSALLCACSGPKQVSAVDFKKHYAWVGKGQTMRDVVYLGQRDGKAFLRVSSMSTVSRKWSDEIIYVELSALDAPFREALPKTEFQQ